MRFLFTIVFILLVRGFYSQNKPEDKYSKEDKAKVKAMTEALKTRDSSLFFSLFKKNLADAKQKNNAYLWPYCYDKLGQYYYFNGDLENASLCFDTALKICKTLKSDDIVAGGMYMNSGAILYALKKYSLSLINYKQAEELLTRSKSPKLGGLLGNISLLYQEIGDLDNAKKYLYRSLPFIKMDSEPDSYAKSLNNLGLIFKKEKNYKASDSIFHIGYEFCKKNKLDNDFSDVAFNLSEMLYLERKLEEAKKIEEDLLPFVEKFKGPSWVKLVALDLAKISYEMHDMASTKKFLAKAESIKLDSNGAGREKLDHLILLAQLYARTKQYEKSCDAFNEYYVLYQKNNNQSDVINLQQLSYNYEKRHDSLTNAKEIEIIELENQHQQEKAEAQLKQQKIVILISLLGFIAIIAFAISLIRANRNKERANKEISHQKALLDEKNKEVTDSIRYAQRIQQSLLPPQDMIDILLPNHFLLYMPKDIVSGDFFWVKKLNANEMFVAVADCTGHGVPGAMMSALSIQNLNELSGQTRSPGELLTLLNANLKNTLNQDQEGFSKDGLDICLCKINVKERKITYSGANRNLNVFNQSGLKSEVKATKAGIGGYTNVKQVYEENDISVDENDLIVMSTDGFADQFGGAQGKKLTTKRFKEWMTEIIPLENKKNELLKRFVTWRGANDQIDDICVLGFKI